MNEGGERSYVESIASFHFHKGANAFQCLPPGSILLYKVMQGSVTLVFVLQKVYCKSIIPCIIGITAS